MKITPVLLVEKIESALPFWVDQIGFEKTVEVPGEDGLAFVILQHGDAELMIQTLASTRRDSAEVAAELGKGPATFIEVDNFDDLLKRINGAPVLLPEHTTFYGMREIVVREPGGNVMCFAARIAQAS